MEIRREMGKDRQTDRGRDIVMERQLEKDVRKREETHREFRLSNVIV